MKECILAKKILLRLIYTFLINISWQVLRVIALFNPKINLFVAGRKNTFEELESKIHPRSKSIWMHVASLGEFEQGLPILERLKLDYPAHKIILTFFSPSGFEIKKNTAAADVVVYLPMDTTSNAKRFLNMVEPEVALFIKYEIWPNYLNELKKRKIPTLLVSAIFSKKQIFFSLFGGFMRSSLKTFSHFFVQDSNSKALLESIGHSNISISGDTRFDRVQEIRERDNALKFMELFKNGHFCIVAGSTWPQDERILIDYINAAKNGIKFVIAPHEIKDSHIRTILEKLQKKTALYSERKEVDLSTFDVLLLNTVGILTKIYSYADIAYVGGAFATGLHNTLEPAAFGIPVLIGPHYHGFKEAEELVALGGVISITDQQDFNVQLHKLLEDPKHLKEVGAVNAEYLRKNRGATDVVMHYLKANSLIFD